MSPLQIQERNPADLTASASNARTHTDKQIRQIAQSIRTFGFNNPVLIDRNDEIVAGHGRVSAALELGLRTVPTIRLEHLTPAQKRAYIIADNKLAELAGWDRDTLAIELQGLVALDLDFEITAMGFEMPEIDLMISEIGAPADAAVDKQMALDRVPAVAREGDLWLLDDHALFCGDALVSDNRPDAAVRARGLLIDKGIDSDRLLLAIKAAPAFFDVLTPNLAVEPWAAEVSAARTVHEQVRAYIDAACGSGPRGLYPLLEGSGYWRRLRKALGNSVAFARVRIFEKLPRACPKCHMELSVAQYEELRDTGVTFCCSLMLNRGS